LTKVAKQQVTAAQQMATAIKAVAGQLARTSQAGPGEHSAVVESVRIITRRLARLANDAGYAVQYRWTESFFDGEVTDPRWLGREAHDAAQLIANGATLRPDYRHLPGARPARPTTLMRRADAAGASADTLDRLLQGAGQYAPNPAEAAQLLGWVHAAVGELVKVLTAQARLAGRMHDAQLADAFTCAAQFAAQGHGALGAVTRIARQEAPVWRSRARRARLKAG
jgi:hypothetical protein